MTDEPRSQPESVVGEEGRNHGAVVSAVGIVSIAVGVVAVCGRGLLLVAPAASLRWFKETIRTNGQIRILAAFALTLGATMVWAGASEDSVLATLLLVFGWVIVGISTPALVLFPGGYRAIADTILPSRASAHA